MDEILDRLRLLLELRTQQTDALGFALAWSVVIVTWRLWGRKERLLHKTRKRLFGPYYQCTEGTLFSRDPAGKSIRTTLQTVRALTGELIDLALHGLGAFIIIGGVLILPFSTLRFMF